MDSTLSEESNLSNTNEVCKIQDPEETAGIANVKNEPRFMHIPYILNGELYEIQTQEGENVTVKCCNCPPDRVYRGSVRSTGNFHMHIKRRHPDLLGKLHDMKVSALLDRRDRFIRNRKTNQRQQQPNQNVLTSQAPSQKEHAATDMNYGLAMATTEVAVAGNSPSQQYTHKLKIKSAFQRHQMLQQQQQLSKQNQTNVHAEEQQQQNVNAQEITTTNDSLDGMKMATDVPANANYLPEPMNLCIEKKTQSRSELMQLRKFRKQLGKQQPHKQQILNSSNVITSSTAVSSSCSNQFNENIRTKHSAVIKKEVLVSPAIVETAIDLRAQKDQNTAALSGNQNDDIMAAYSAGANTNSVLATHAQRESLLYSVHDTLAQILNEIRLRNQLDFAKFKFLHPNFQFQL